jgi:hypothetical protein
MHHDVWCSISHAAKDGVAWAGLKEGTSGVSGWRPPTPATYQSIPGGALILRCRGGLRIRIVEVVRHQVLGTDQQHQQPHQHRKDFNPQPSQSNGAMEL